MATTNTRNTKGTTNIGEIIRVIKAYENYTTEQCRDLIAEAKHEGPEARAKALEYCAIAISQFGQFKTLLEELVQERFAKQAEGTEFDELASKMPKELQALRDDYNKQQEEQRRKKWGAYISPFREGDDAMTKPRKQMREYHRMPEARRLFGNYTPLAKSTLRALKALARNECANCYDDGRVCIMTDKPCFQINASGVACEYFKQCVLPLDKELYATLIQRTSLKNCPRCGNDFFPTNNRQIYCPDCGAIERKKKTAERARKHREKLATQNRATA